MKYIFLSIIISLLAIATNAQHTPFRFAFISDTHIGAPNGPSDDDLRRTVSDINSMDGIAFVVITGDITELGTNEELQRAKRILDSLAIPYYIIPGNHDTGWSESGGAMFSTVFGYDRFSFEHNGIRFIGCASGPYVRMSDGHVPRDAVNWLDAELKKLKPSQPVIFLNHYPLDNGLDNWYEITDRLRQYNTWCVLCGHGHMNKALNFEDIPGVMGRSNLRAKATVGGYNIVDVTSDSIRFTERRPGVETLPTWTSIAIKQAAYDQKKQFARPDYSINSPKNVVDTLWTYSSSANIISTPLVTAGKVIVGNQNGEVVALSMQTHKVLWNFNTNAAIFSSPAATANNTCILASADSSIYCINVSNGKLVWKKKTDAAVLGSPLVHNGIVYIGGSDHRFLALRTKDGSEVWSFNGLEGPVVSTPLLYEGKIIFGAWDRHLYALNSTTGALLWKWNNGSSVRNYSPASCIPVATNGVVYIVAPDRFITAIDANSGQTLWRSKDGGVRESIGISNDGKWIYGKSMQDTIVAYKASREPQAAAWKMHAGFGYEHVPTMLIEKNGQVFFGTRSGVVYSINPNTQQLNWRYKIDNSMVNTVNVVDANTIVVTTMDGRVVVMKVVI